MSGISEFKQSFFDASSKAWKKNKTKYDQACYTYKKDAFKGMEELPQEVVSKAVLLKNSREINKRLKLQEEAPLPNRRSPRLREQHVRETYS
jgi:hypothetical protein